MATKKYSRNKTSTYRETINLDTGVIVRTQTNVNTNYSSLLGSINLNYGGTLKFMFLFAMVVLFSSFALNGGFSEVLVNNTINESLEVVDGYSYNVYYTYYDWSKKINILSGLVNIFDFRDVAEWLKAFNLSDKENTLSYIFKIIGIPLQILKNIIQDIYIILRFIIVW